MRAIRNDMWLEGPEKWWSTITFGMRAIFCVGGDCWAIHKGLKSFLKEHTYLYLQIWPSLATNFHSLWVWELLRMTIIRNDMTSRAREMMINHRFCHASNFLCGQGLLGHRWPQWVEIIFKKQSYFLASLILITKIINAHEVISAWDFWHLNENSSDEM